ncbi:MAG TPA: type II toxin-antitoxin system RelE/ParE family toxin [Caulobacteraceae bacterium]|nr:type II toxin-antitoxin system RelE/ParE family toxin [Caulobacteraceae bacterium]
MAWRIELTATAAKQLSKLGRKEAQRITSFLRERAAGAPRTTGGPLSGPLGELWRYRIGDWRVLCEIEDEVMRVLVVRIAHRSDAYRR